MHPFMLFTYMSGSQWSAPRRLDQPHRLRRPRLRPQRAAAAVPEQLRLLHRPDLPRDQPRHRPRPGRQHGLRRRHARLRPGPLTGWTAVGNYEWTRVDLIRHNFVNQGNCSTGRHEMTSTGPFGLWVWGWGSPETTMFTANVSYGYPGGHERAAHQPGGHPADAPIAMAPNMGAPPPYPRPSGGGLRPPGFSAGKRSRANFTPGSHRSAHDVGSGRIFQGASP